MSLTGGGCEMNWLLWDPAPEMLTQQVSSRDCWNIQPMFVSNLASAKLPFTGCLQPKHPATEDILTNSGVRIYSKISGRCLTRTCTWTCFWKGNCIVKCLVPTSRQQCLHVLNRCVESSSFKWNVNHLSVPSLPTSYKQLWSFPLAGQAQPHKSIPGVSQGWAVIFSLLYHNIWWQREAY